MSLINSTIDKRAAHGADHRLPMLAPEQCKALDQTARHFHRRGHHDKYHIRHHADRQSDEGCASIRRRMMGNRLSPQISLRISSMETPSMTGISNTFVEELSILIAAPDHEFGKGLFQLIARIERDFHEEET